jgi:hypothetical protein
MLLELPVHVISGTHLLHIRTQASIQSGNSAHLLFFTGYMQFRTSLKTHCYQFDCVPRFDLFLRSARSPLPSLTYLLSF